MLPLADVTPEKGDHAEPVLVARAGGAGRGGRRAAAAAVLVFKRVNGSLFWPRAQGEQARVDAALLLPPCYCERVNGSLIWPRAGAAGQGGRRAAAAAVLLLKGEQEPVLAACTGGAGQGGRRAAAAAVLLRERA